MLKQLISINSLRKEKGELEDGKYKNDLNHLLVKAIFFHLHKKSLKDEYDNLPLGVDRKIFLAIETNNFLIDYFKKSEEEKNEFESKVDIAYKTEYIGKNH